MKTCSECIKAWNCIFPLTIRLSIQNSDSLKFGFFVCTKGIHTKKYIFIYEIYFIAIFSMWWFLQLFIVVCSLAAVARGSLEPAGYRQPGSDPQSAYLPPSTFARMPDNRYVPSLVDSRSQPKFPRGSALTTKNSPVPSSEYLPADRQSSRRDTHADNYSGAGKPSTRYVPAPEIRHSFTQAEPAVDYLPPRQSLPSNSYLAPKKSAAGFSPIASGFSPSGQYPVSGNHFNKKLDQANSGHYPSHAGLNPVSKTAGYRYNALENQVSWSKKKKFLLFTSWNIIFLNRIFSSIVVD